MSDSPKTIKIGISGLGRSGHDIHVKGLGDLTDQFKVVAVFDPITPRATQTASDTGARVIDSFEALIADDEVELIVAASMNAHHAQQATAALKAHKHVLCEKPFGLTVADVDMMIQASKESGKVLQPFQQRRQEVDFQKVKEICESGILGEIQFVRICWHGFYRRWDWQTDHKTSGGALNNNGPHPIDHAMILFGDENPNVWCEMRSVLCSGDAEDYLKVILTGKGRPTVEVELHSNVAYPQDRWLICGSKGGLRGTGDKLDWKSVDFSKMPPRPLELEPLDGRAYCGEEIQWVEDSWASDGGGDGGAGAAPSTEYIQMLYRNLFDVIRKGSEQKITPQSVRSRIGVLEKCRVAAANLNG
ncbi:MAG: Gfo/Idh/MocA family oxidoreductase [Phycisphaeraceae bacterium]|nr:Gfo/Idh/MocA family oxidoreductase [Phycisphaeraceae bacterium]